MQPPHDATGRQHQIETVVRVHRRTFNLAETTRAASLLLVVMWGASLSERTAEAQQQSVRTLSGQTMGTTYSIKYEIGPEEPAESELRQLIEQRLRRVDECLSTWREDSEVSRFNSHQSTDWFAVSSETAVVVQKALEIHSATEGAFDVTVRPVLQAWGFGSGASQPRLPSESELAQLMQRVGSEKVHVRHDPPALRKDHVQLTLDLSALAKGYGVDQLAIAMHEAGVVCLMVEIGGEVRAIGKRSAGGQLRGWRIGIEAPLVEKREAHTIVQLVDRALATSGNYRQFFELDGRRYVHVIDPRTGRPVEQQLASVSVMADTCMEADALATALLVLGAEDGRRWAAESDVSAMFLTRSRKSIDAVMTGDFGQWIVAPASAAEGEWWPVFVAAAVAFGLAVLGMAVGVLISNRRLKGSCGGLSSIPGAGTCSLCEACDKTPASCPETQAGPVACETENTQPGPCSESSGAGI